MKNYRDFILEGDLDLGGLGGDTKEKEPVDPAKEIADKKAKALKKSRVKREEILEDANEKLKEIFAKSSNNFRKQFEDAVFDSTEKDDRVVYHNVILNIQTYQIPFSRDNDSKEIDNTEDVIEVLQELNKKEYLA